MINLIDIFLDKITMYRLVLYVLISLSVVAVIFGFLGILPFTGLSIIESALFLLIICWATNLLFAKTFKAPVNVESFYITSIILLLIVSPAQNIHDFIFLGWVGILAMASKYIIAIGRKHIFNPAAFAVTLTAFTLNQSASWWIGTSYMLPFVIIGGLLVVRKIRFGSLVISFLFTSIIVTLVFSLGNGHLLTTLSQILVGSPLFFFAFIMLTEPLTLPPTKKLKILYGSLTGFLFAPQVHLGSFYFTPEVALLTGNFFSSLVSPRQKLLLLIEQKLQISPDTMDFIFKPPFKLAFEPGQYMEWTLDHPKPDSRGNGRYFTIASSPTEDTLRLGVKIQENASSYKNAMKNMNKLTPIVASQLAGDFTLPVDKNKKLVFMAGGIGVTPYRSILKYLIDKRERRDIVLFYSNKKSEDIVYKDIFDQAYTVLGIRTIYSITDTEAVPEGWTGKTGRIDAKTISEEVPDFAERTFYLSGPHGMVTAYEQVLKDMGIPGDKLRKTFFRVMPKLSF